uniref:Sushi domain-containing protein n=1 Tax=Parascaris equorum TaxID=6256 RepID=A0A914RHT5_PAREQ
MVNIANMEQSTIFQVNIARQVQSSAEVGNIGAICKLTKYCAPIVCDMGSFIQHKQIYLEVPSVKSIPSGATINIPCKADPSNVFNITYACKSTGEFQPHPSDKRCVPAVEAG